MKSPEQQIREERSVIVARVALGDPFYTTCKLGQDTAPLFVLGEELVSPTVELSEYSPTHLRPYNRLIHSFTTL